MQIVIHNKRELDTLKRSLDQARLPMAFTVDEFEKMKTLKQVEFFFAGIAGSAVTHFKKLGTVYKANEVKEIFYKSLVTLGIENLTTRLIQFNGEPFVASKRISTMTTKEMSEFIEHCLWLVDNSVVFEGMYLHPSIRYSWTRYADESMFIKHELPRNDKEYLEYVRKLPCIWCGRANHSQAHHLKEAGQNGEGYKSDDWFALPLCDTCHKHYHDNGRDEFLADLSWLKIPLIEFCKINYNKWRNKI